MDEELTWTEDTTSNLMEFYLVGCFLLFAVFCFIIGIWILGILMIGLSALMVGYLKILNFQPRSPTGVIYSIRRMDTPSLIDVYGAFELLYGIPTQYTITEDEITFSFTRKEKVTYFKYEPKLYKFTLWNRGEEQMDMVDDICRDHSIEMSKVLLDPVIPDLDIIMDHVMGSIKTAGRTPYSDRSRWKRSNISTYILIVFILDFVMSMIIFVPLLTWLMSSGIFVEGLVSLFMLTTLMMIVFSPFLYTMFRVFHKMRTSFPEYYSMEDDGIHFSHYKDGYDEVLKWESIDTIKGMGLPLVMEVVPKEGHDWGPVISESILENHSYAFIIGPDLRYRITSRWEEYQEY